MMVLEGRHALVTGGGSGIGLAIARALASTGVRVTITGRRMETLDQAAADTPGLFPMVMDVTDEDMMRDVLATARAERGPVTICVASAGLVEGRALTKTSLGFWRKIMATNLDGTFLAIRETLPDMEAAHWGRVIAVSSCAGLQGLRGASAYAASKHGVVGLIRTLAQDYGDGPITFNALCPGQAETRGADRAVRLVSPERVAAAALELVGPGSEAISGQAVEIGGGPE